jgi:hypothetical protein
MDVGANWRLAPFLALLPRGGGSLAGLRVSMLYAFSDGLACLFIVRRVICLSRQGFLHLSTERCTVSGDGMPHVALAGLACPATLAVRMASAFFS